MASDSTYKTLLIFCLLARPSHSMPSFDHGSFDSASVLALGSVLNPRSEPFEIRGVYGGRKKRFIVQRDEPSSCCKGKVTCIPSIGQILKDCKCSKCPPGLFPAFGTDCQDKCPDGMEIPSSFDVYG